MFTNLRVLDTLVLVETLQRALPKSTSLQFDYLMTTPHVRK
jgi:hypothetical protein